jgi:hypothetical protein
MIVILTGAGILTLAGLVAQVVLTEDPKMGLEMEPVSVEEHTAAEASALVAEPAPAVELAPQQALGLEIDRMEADSYRGFITQVGEGWAPSIDASALDNDVKEADSYGGFITQVGEGWVPSIDASALDYDVKEADSYRGFIIQVGEGWAQAGN